MKANEPSHLQRLLRHREDHLVLPESGEEFLTGLHQKIHRDALIRSTFPLALERVWASLRQIRWAPRGFAAAVAVAVAMGLGLGTGWLVLSVVLPGRSSEQLAEQEPSELAAPPFMASISTLDYSDDIPVFSVQPSEF